MEKPLIGVTPLWDAEKQSLWMLPGYLRSVQHAGGIPLLLPFDSPAADIARLADACDGFLFTGGQDIDPAHYRQVPIEQCGEIAEKRDALELALFREAVENRRKPALGICRGHQLFNVALGGTLVQDIYAQTSPALGHRQEPPYEQPCHTVQVLPGTPLHELTGEDTLQVNSMHHQVVGDLAPGLLPMALSDEGYIEALYRPHGGFLLSVQWHPEYCTGQKQSDVLFAALIGACTQ